MTYKRFSEAFQITAEMPYQPVGKIAEEIRVLIECFGGKTFNKGLYRILNADELIPARAAMERAFPEKKGLIEPFAYDWLGRHFALDFGGAKPPLIVMFEVGAGEALQIPVSVEDFHNIELIDFAEDVLSLSFWNRWLEGSSGPLEHSHCVGYKIPLFLGGVDELSNLEIIDLSVYVELCGQLRNKACVLPRGQSISQISMGK